MRVAIALFVAAALAACQPGANIRSPLSAPVARTEAPVIETTPAIGSDARAYEAPRPARDEHLPCDPESDEAKAAQEAIAQIGARAAALRDDDPVKPVTDELEALLQTQCFRLSWGDPLPPLSFDSGLALRTWWNDGAEAWLRHYLELDENRTVVIPPSPRHTLLADGNASHPLAPLLCPSNSKACGRETTGWLRRADAALLREARAQAGRRTEEACAAQASSAEPDARYGVFRQCLEGVGAKRVAMRLGKFKAPADGWLVVRDTARRCETIRAYELTSGAAYVAELCSAPPTVRAGRVSVAAAREATWMLALAQTADRNVRTTTEAYSIPDDISILRAAYESGSMSLGYTLGGAPSRARHWSWMRASNGALVGQVSGIYVRPSGRTDAEAYALELLDVADDSFEEGCSPSGPPAHLAWSAPGDPIPGRERAVLATSSNDATRTALARARRPGNCTATR